ARRQRRVGKIRPFAALAIAEKHHTVAPLLERLRPWQPFNTEFGDAFGEKAGIVVIEQDRHRPLAENDGAEPPAAAGAQRRARPGEGDTRAGSDTTGKMCLDFSERERRGRKKAALRGAAGEFGPR